MEKIAEVVSDKGDEVDHQEDVEENSVKKKRRHLRGKITRSMNRIRNSVSCHEITKRRLQKELEEVRKDIASVFEINSELYDYLPTCEHSKLDRWEAELSNDRFAFEEEIEDYLASLMDSDNNRTGIESHHANDQVLNQQSVNNQLLTEQPVSSHVSDRQTSNGNSANISAVNGQYSNRQFSNENILNEQSSTRTSVPTVRVTRDVSRLAFDSWLSNLTEYGETQLAEPVQNMSVGEVLYRLESSRDIPSVTLSKFDGNPLKYVEFIETFKIHVHDKPHLTDDMRMVQLKMHLTGDAERAILGLGSGGLMYATALQIIKEQFGQESVIARAFINKLTKGSKVMSHDREALRDLSLDIVNCVATLQRMNYFSDANTTESLRQIVRRFPDHLILKWKSKVTEIRDRGEIPNLQHVSNFLRKEIKSAFDPDFGDIETGRKIDWRSGQNNVHKDYRRGVHAAQHLPEQVRRLMKCYMCNENHRVMECPTFVDSSVAERVQFVKDNRLCFGCLVRGHISKDCRSKKRCGKNSCDRRHHPLLHTDPPSASGATSTLDRNGILPVVRARFRSQNGHIREGSILIDSGAATTIIRKDFARALGLQGKRQGLELSVVGGERIAQKDSRRVKFWISSICAGEEFEVEAHEIDKTVISVCPLDRPWLSSFPHLSDIEFSHKAGPIDLILGVQYTHLHVEEEIRQGLHFEPVAKRTKLGWFVIGADSSKAPAICSVNFVQKIDMSALYDFETLGVRVPDCSCPKRVISPDGKRVMDMFEQSCHKEGNRYMIGLPWKKDSSILPNNYSLAEKRLWSLERSLLKNREKAEMYDRVIEEYVRNQWAVPLTNDELNADVNPVYYLPHHGVHRPDKVSTPLRVVFDPACFYKGVSLNSLLHKGPCLIGDLYGVLLRFREENVAFVGDISKMFLQILLPEQDSHVHRFLWRRLQTSEKPTIYRLTRVTFGDKPSPDMASFVMLKLAEEFKTAEPDAANIIQHDRYVDDLIHSCKTPAEAVKQMNGLNKILASGSFKIKEWFCSSKEANMNIKIESEQKSFPNVSLDKKDTVKTLGVCWNSNTDTIHYQVKDVDVKTLTKRIVLSKLSMLYDPLGLAAVITVKSRIAMQDIWRLKNIDWDDALPDDVCEVWKRLFQDMKKLETISFPRCLKPENVSGTSELHVFADASAKAYGAVAYLLWHTSTGPSIRLVSAKVRVAPLKQTTIPRLELMAALIASRLAKTVFEELREKPMVTLWSDSQIVLHWIRSDSINLKAFVGVRIAEIQNTWNPEKWKFVPTTMNPADDLSRGLEVKEMDGRWMNGPAFLSKPKHQWPEQQSFQMSQDEEQKQTKLVCANVKTIPSIDCRKFSSWQRLLRVTAYCFRYVHNLKSKIDDQTEMVIDTLQPEEIEKAENYWIHVAQEGLDDHEKRYQDLTPFNENGIIRVGGRLQRSTLPYEQVHPVLLPASSYVSTLILRDIHNMMGHPGSERTLCESRRKYWIVKGRNLVRKTLTNCTICRKLRQPPYETLMGDLPPERLKSFSPPFTTTGVDLFGPFKMKYGRNKTTKAWGVLFTCATVRLIHLEIMDGLSTGAFMQALRRFVAHHGWPNTIISDNGSSFIGAQAELKKLFQEGRKQIQDFAMLHKVKWMFITPLSPHQGGFYESLIKQVKQGIQVVVGQQTLSWSEMSTVFAEVQCLVNSRPLGYLSNDPNDPQPLTPNHFLLGRATTEVPQGPFRETKNIYKRYEFVQTLINQFWKRFIREYFQLLMRRTKWTDKGRQMKVGDIVLLTDHNVSRGKWDLARITEVYPGHDGIIRNIQVKTKYGVYKRSVQRCCLIVENTD